ncbi:MAG: hypothetical protein AAF735_01425 [Myxococcota bacterium]
MAQDELERLTLPFESRAANGYGLGLALVKDICEREGWVLSFESPEGEGLSVVVRFHGVESEASLTKVLSNGGGRPVPDDSR